MTRRLAVWRFVLRLSCPTVAAGCAFSGFATISLGCQRNARSPLSAAEPAPAMTVETGGVAAEDFRLRARKIIQKDLPRLHTEAEVDAYLSHLEKQATANRVVTWLEIGPAKAAIQKLVPIIGQKAAWKKEVAFSTRMQELQNSFEREEGRTP